MLSKKVKENVDAVVHLLNTPFAIPGSKESISLYQALQNYPSQEPESSDLAKLMKAFIANPEAAKTYAHELEMAGRELKKSA